MDSSVHLIYHDPSDLGSLILIRIISKERTFVLIIRLTLYGQCMTNFQGPMEFKVNTWRYVYFFVYTNMSVLFKNVTQRLLGIGERKGRKEPRGFSSLLLTINLQKILNSKPLSASALEFPCVVFHEGPRIPVGNKRF